MTGIFVRVQRDGRWQNAEFDQLTDAEMQDYVARSIQAAPSLLEAALDGWGWATALAQWIRDHTQAEPAPGGPGG